MAASQPDRRDGCSEIATGLWQGEACPVPTGRFGHVVSLDTASARYYPAPHGSSETRLWLRDAGMERNCEVVAAIRDTHRRWAAGCQVLVRCAAGLNRSGLIVAGILIADGFTADHAIAQVRARRHPDALGNPASVRWLRSPGVAGLLSRQPPAGHAGASPPCSH